MESLKILDLIEKVYKEEHIDEFHLRDECEKTLICLLQTDLDLINTYHRRSLGISDDEWREAKEELKSYLGVENEVD